jgi:ABC-type lipoprotein release transport system permease subunit
VSFLGAAAALLLVATLASIPPALRVMAVQPSEALHYE